jgi:hypothetical protein
MAEKRPNYETNLLPLLFPYECIKRLDFSQVKYLKTIGPIFDKTTDLKVNFTKWPNFVFSAAEFFGQSDWIILKRVCHTSLDGDCRII